MKRVVGAGEQEGRVCEEHGGERLVEVGIFYQWEASSWPSRTWGNGRRVSLDSATDGSVTGDTAADTEAEASRSGEPGTFRDRVWTWNQPWWHQCGNWTYGGWQEDSTEVQPDCELLPRFVQGWYLLADANLSQTEKNLVQTALNGDFDVDKVAQELRNQWSDSELRHRDQGRHGSYLGDLAEDDVGEDVVNLTEDTAWVMQSDMSPEVDLDLTEADKDVQDAMVAALEPEGHFAKPDNVNIR